MANRLANAKADGNSIASVYNRICALLCCAACGSQTQSPVSVCSGGHAHCTSCRTDPNAKTLNIVNKIADLVSKDVDATAFQKALRDLFECPVCYKIPRTEDEYEMCARGHLVCRFCYLMTAYCPLCRATESTRINPLIKRIVTEIRKGYKCRFSEFGCSETCDIFVIPQHEDSCRFRRFNCLVEGCQWLGTADDIFNHGQESHKEMAANRGRVKFSEGILKVRFGNDEAHPYWLLYNLVPEGLSLVVQSHRDTKTGLTAKIVLGQPNGPNVQFNHPVLTIADDPLMALMSQQRLEVPNDLVVKYLNSNELIVDIDVEESGIGSRTNWLSPFNVFTAAFILQFLLFSVKHGST